MVMFLKVPTPRDCDIISHLPPFSALRYAYARRIMLGLSCCMLGDALLVFPGFFLEGMAAFAAGHLFYISAFGFKPVNPYAGAVLYSLGAAGESSLPSVN